MAFVVKDRVRETTLTTGTGTVTLAGAVIGYQTFSAIGDGNNTFYTIAGQATSEWEVGIGTYTASGTTLSRDTILASSNSGSAVNFSAGTKDVFVTYPAGKAIFQNNLDSVVVAANTSSDALRITQTGSGNALVVEDSTNPDATPFVVDASGVVGIGTTTPIAGVSLTLVPSAGEAVVAYKNADDAGGAVQRFRKSRGTFASPTVVQSGDTTGLTVFQGYDGANYLQTANITSAVDGTPGTNDMPGRLIFSTTADGASSPTERMRIDNAGRIGIGQSPNDSMILGLTGTPSATYSYAVQNNATFQSTVTSEGAGYITNLKTAAASFTLTQMQHFRAIQGALGAASTVTNQYGFIADTSLTGATNNYGFYSNIASGTNRWNFYAAGTAQNSFAGNVLIGSTSSSPFGKLTVAADRASLPFNTVFSTYNGASFENDFLIAFTGTVTNVGNYQSFPIAFLTNSTERMRIDSSGNVGIGGTASAFTRLQVTGTLPSSSNASYGISSSGTIPSTTTSSYVGFDSAPSTAVGSFTLTNLNHFFAYQGTIGAGSTVTNQYGFNVSSTLTGATNNFGFFSNIASGTGRYNFYANGTASNFFGGNTIISVADNTNAALRITQTGTGNAILVEDSANPDATPFVIDASGNVVIGDTGLRTGPYGLQPIAQVSGATLNTSSGLFVDWANSDTTGPALLFAKAKSGLRGTQGAVVNGTRLFFQTFSGSDGTNFIPAAQIEAAVDGTPGTNDMPGRLTFSTTADGASSPTERMRIDSAGRVGIGIAPATSTGVYVNQATTDAVAYGFLNTQTAGSSTTNTLRAFQTSINTSAASFTLGSLNHYFASQGSLGAGSSVTNQLGFVAPSNLTGATNNYGFYSDIASGTGRWNFYANGSANNYFNGSVGIGDVPVAGYKTLVTGSWTGATTYYGVASQGTAQSDVTSAVYAFRAAPSTAAAAFTLTTMAGYVAEGGTVGAGSTVTNLIGFQAASSITTATNNYGFFSDIASGTGRWNFFASGSANNYFNGNVGIGTAGPSYKLDIYGGSLGTTAGNQIIAQQLRVLTSNDDKLEFSKIRVSSGADWTTAGWRLQQKVDVTWHGYIQFNGNNNEGISFGTGSSTVSANSVTERMRIDSSGLVGIGGSSYAGVTLRAVKSITGSTFSTGILSDGTVQSDVTGAAYYFQAATTTAASAFTTTTIAGFLARQNTIGAGSTVTGQYGFFADSTLTGATNNYGFFSNIASGTGRWNFYANGSANNYFNGSVGIGTTSLTGWTLRVSKNITGGTSGFGVGSDGSIQSDVTSAARMFISQPSTAAASFTLTILDHYLASQGTIGAGSIVTSQYGFNASSSLIGATNNYGFVSDIPSGTGRWNFYAGGTADNYFDGRVGIGGFPESDAKLVVGGTLPSNANSSKAYVASFFVPGSSTSSAFGFLTYANTSATAFTLSNLYHYTATQGTVGAGSAISSQYGFNAAASLTGATNNYGFYSNIASGTGRWNFYANGTADNYFAGRVGIGATPDATSVITQFGTVSGGTTGYLINSNVTAGSSVTSAFIGFSSFVNTSASAFTLTSLTHVLASQGTIGAGSTVTNQFGYRAASTLTGATNNYGFYSDIASGSGRWNFYASGTAANYFAGDMQLDKTVTAAGTTGAQTINKNAGTVNFAAAATSLVVTDSRVSTTSIIICTVGTNDSTMKSVAAVAGAGSFTLHANAAATAETRVNFLIIN